MRVQFPDACVELELTVTRLSGDLYRLDAVPELVESAGYRDVVEAVETGPQCLRVTRVVEHSNWRTHELALSFGFLGSDEVQKMLKHVSEIGGYWEHGVLGILYVCLPRDADFDPRRAIGIA